jgi:hypothetical protein
VSSQDQLCRGCGARLKWIKTTRGKWMPCNDTALVYVINEATGAMHAGYTPHWATCPSREQFKPAVAR